MKSKTGRAMENEENQKQVFHRFPLPLEIAKGAISTFPQPRRRAPWKSGNPKAGFPLSHRASLLFHIKKGEQQHTVGCANLQAHFRIGIYSMAQFLNQIT